MLLTGCQKQDEVVVDTPTPEPENDYILADLALSLPASPGGTRQSANVVQTDVSKFRGIQQLCITPFSTVGKVGPEDNPTYFESTSSYEDLMATNLAAQEHWLYYEKVYLMHGVGSFLTYGRAKLSDDASKSTNGSLLLVVDGKSSVGIPERLTVTPSNLHFELEPIYNKTELSNEAVFLASYLTYIAEAQVLDDSWKNSNDVWLHNLYEDFIKKDQSNQENNVYNIIAGSVPNVKAFIKVFNQKITEKLDHHDYEDGSMEQRILQNIQDRLLNYYKNFGSRRMTVSSDGNGGITLGNCENYPGNLGLPDGAAVLLWEQKEDGTYGFVPQTETSPMANICSINRYVYPAELYYYANSPIKTSNVEVPSEAYDELPSEAYSETGVKTWKNVVDYYYKSGSVVTSNTKAVAMVEPIQYAVARLSASVQTVSKDNPSEHPSILKDIHDTEVNVNDLPITGIIISGQNPVGFDFVPGTVDDGEDHERFIYDCHLNEDEPLYFSTTAPTTYPIHTLLLQTKEDEDVTVILELRNDSANPFESVSGVIYPGTKFYLVGKIRLSNKNTEGVDNTVVEDVQKRVFTKDFTSYLNMKVSTLANAFNVMPNVQADRLQISIEMDLKWIQTEPTSVELTEEGDGELTEEESDGD